jgi:hypothetical protein
VDFQVKEDILQNDNFFHNLEQIKEMETDHAMGKEQGTG